jgi:regulator of protease activity HflC (stomatin/prohibitin superfamily)
MEEPRRQFIPGPGILMLAILLLGAVGALLHDYRDVPYDAVGAFLWGGAVLLTFVLGTTHISRRVLPIQGTLGWTEGFRLLWRSYTLGVNHLLAGRRHEPMASTSKAKKVAADNVLSPSFKLLGAGFLFSHEAAAITRGNSFVRADGPGLVFLHPNETIAQVFDLRDQTRSQDVQATTRDGIPIDTKVTVSFHVRRLAPGQRRPRSVEMDTIPYAYDRGALFHLTYAGSITGDDNRLSWADQICPQAATLLVSEIGRYTLDELLISGAAKPLDDIKKNVARGLAEMQQNDGGPSLPQGIAIQKVNVGPLVLPQDVVAKRIKTWQVDWAGRAQKAVEDSKLELQHLTNQARAHALADSIDSLLASIEAVHAQGETQLHDVILAQVVNVLENMATNETSSGLPRRTQWISLAADTSQEIRHFLEQEE